MLTYPKLIIQEVFQKGLNSQMLNQSKATNFLQNQMESHLTNQKNQVVLLEAENLQ